MWEPTLEDLVLPSVQADLLVREPSAGLWLRRLLPTLSAVQRDWDLRLVKALYGGRTGCVVVVAQRLDLRRTTELVLKIPLEEHRAVLEAEALRALGDACPHVLAVDAVRGAILMEKLEGATLRDLDPRGIPTRAELAALVELLTRLRRPAPKVDAEHLVEFHRRRLLQGGVLREVAPRTRIPSEKHLERALALLDSLGEPSVLIHGDLNAGNVIDGVRLRAIDPRPLLGDPAYDVAVLSLKRDPVSAEATARLLAAAMGDKVGRVLAWLDIARTSRV